MYPNHLPMNYYFPNSQEAYLYPTPFQEENYYHVIPEDLRFGGFQPSFPPPFSPPSQGPGFGQGPGQGPTSGPPTSPPPSFVPQQQAEAFAVDPGGIRRCLFRFTYVWLRGFNQFWFYPTFVGRNSVSGYRWTGYRWIYFGLSLRQIQSFTCF
ncbi:MAG: hypothetical protein K0Q87_2572 [Neobacillus sp.]|nr:hypothetical protein [Neobacillus sp.]